MSGSFIKSGVLTNNGYRIPKLDEKYLNSKVKDILLHIIPLSLSNSVSNIRTSAGIIKQFIPCITYPSLTHMAVQLNLENCKDVLFIEYGEYFTEGSNLNNKNIFSSSSFTKGPRQFHDQNFYYYINEDGARITVITEQNIMKYYEEENIFGKSREFNELNIPHLITRIVAKQHYQIDELPSFSDLKNNYNNFYRVECDIQNKTNLRNLIEYLKGDKWLAKKYNVVFHNCQDFAAELIKFFKAIRRHEKDRIRIREKVLLPNCIVNALIRNEGLQSINVLGRIPIFGYFHDWYKIWNIDNCALHDNQ